MDISKEPSHRVILLGSVAAAMVCAAALLASSPGLPMVWDEGDAIFRADGIARGQWHYTTVREGHPALYGMLIVAGRWISQAWLSPLSAARFGPTMLFAAATGALFYRIGRDRSIVAAVAAVAALMTMPRMFAHAHFALLDGPLTSCWVLAWAVFLPASRSADHRFRWSAAVVWGIVLGMTLSSKATGWIAPIPFVAWAAVYRNGTAAKTIAVGLPIALLAFLLLNPPLWHDPLHGWLTFFRLNFNRSADPGLNISTWFLGRMYNLEHALPWYNTLLWTAVTVPIATLLLSGFGLAAAWPPRRDNATMTLLVFNWVVLLIVRALPGTPPHDGIRLFLPSFAFLAALAGIGCDALFVRLSSRHGKWCIVLLAASASTLPLYRPQWLSYYNLLIGGLPGATAAGMEPTYYWDGLDRSVLDWLHEHTADDEKICFAASSPQNLALMRRWQVLRRATARRSPGRFRWYVLQRRPSGYRPADPWLIEHVEPAYRKTLLGTSLVEVYEYEDFQRACRHVHPKENVLQ